MLLKAPAKINLSLRILSKRADGFHEISSLMRAISLFDEVRAELAPSGKERVALSVQGGGIPSGPGNLAYRAAELAFDTWGARRAGSPAPGAGEALHAKIELKKNIPVAAGLAGGSSDAAAVLLALAKKLSPETSLEEIAALGAALGADVPFCVHACAAANPALGHEGSAAMLAEGIGGRLCPAEAAPAWAVLVNPGIEISAGEAYSLYDGWAAKASGPESGAGTQHGPGNDLERPCAEAYPAVAEALAALRSICQLSESYRPHLSPIVQLSGSGPTVFAWFEGEDGAGAAAKMVYSRAKTAFPGMFVYLCHSL